MEIHALQAHHLRRCIAPETNVLSLRVSLLHADDELNEAFPQFYYDRKLVHQKIFDIPPDPKPLRIAHSDVAQARRNETEFLRRSTPS